MANRKRMPLTPADRQVLATLAKKGELQERIASVLGCYPGTVRYWARKLGIELRREIPKAKKPIPREQNVQALGTETYQIDTKEISVQNASSHGRKGESIWLIAICQARTRPVKVVYLTAVYSQPTGEDTARAIHEAKLGPGPILGDIGAEFANPAFRLATVNRMLILARGWRQGRMTKPDIERVFSNFARLRAVKIQVQALHKVPDQAEKNRLFPAILATFREHLTCQGRLEQAQEQAQDIKVPIQLTL